MICSSVNRAHSICPSFKGRTLNPPGGKSQWRGSGRTITYDPPMDWTLSGEAKRYIENSVIATAPACAAAENAKAIDAVVGKLGR